jgi:NAD(P)-dependent dehydrogenase (short-subunit alcohol dehydrogenase family)
MHCMFNPFSLEDKTILVTGASSGIGRGISVQCSKMGAKLILNGRDRERLEETLDSLEGDGHVVILSDLSSQVGIEELIDKMPNIDGCVFSAGIPKVSPIKFFKREDVNEIFDINSIAPIMITSLMLKKKKLNKNSSIVFISAVTGVFVGSCGDTSYCASKGAVGGFVKGAALELAPHGIRVNSVNPGLVPTNILKMSNDIFSDEHHKDIMVSKYPLKRLGKPEDIANGVIYLLSDASSWVTGINLVIDGGYILS